MIVLRSTMDAAVEAERVKARQELLDLASRYGGALVRVTALQAQFADWVTGKADGFTPEQFAALFYAHDDRWQAAVFNVMQGVVTAHHDALPADQIWGKSPGVPAGEGQWCHMAQHLDDKGRETLDAMHWHAKAAVAREAQS